MANPAAVLSNIDEIAYLSGIFDWEMSNGSYVPPGVTGSVTPVAFHVINNLQIPLEQYASGAINTFNFVSGQIFPGGDPNTKLFNTLLNADGLRENIQRKYTINRIPFANYDQPVDLGAGGQRIAFNVVFAGTQYLTAMKNLVQAIFNNQNPGLGTLNHPFYNKIKNVLPLEFNPMYDYKQLNCVICQLIFYTSDLSHLNPGIGATSLTTILQEAFIGTQNTITSLSGTVAAAKTLISQASAQIL